MESLTFSQIQDENFYIETISSFARLAAERGMNSRILAGTKIADIADIAKKRRKECEGHVVLIKKYHRKFSHGSIYNGYCIKCGALCVRKKKNNVNEVDDTKSDVDMSFNWIDSQDVEIKLLKQQGDKERRYEVDCKTYEEHFNLAAKNMTEELKGFQRKQVQPI